MHLGSFEGERRCRCRGFDKPSTPAQDWSSLAAVLTGIAIMLVITAGGFAAVLS